MTICKLSDYKLAIIIIEAIIVQYTCSIAFRMAIPNIYSYYSYVLNMEQLRVNYETTTVQLHMNYKKTIVILQMVTTVFDTIFTITLAGYYAVLHQLFLAPTVQV